MTLAELPLQFDQPEWLLLLLLIVPIVLMARRSIAGLGRVKAYSALVLRIVVVLLLTVALTEPHLVRRGEGVTTTIILDRSQSVPLSLKADSVAFLRQAAQAKEEDEDRVAVITVARDASISAMPDENSRVTTGIEPGDLTATNLASAVRLALAIMPDDTANRIVLASDGNETVDSVLAAADLARANDVPVDIMLLEYEHRNEVTFDRIIAPARARMGQTVNLKLVMRGQSETEGRITLTMNGQALDLTPDEAGDSLPVTVPVGPRVIPISLSLDDAGPQKFEAIFEPNDSNDDMIVDNNRAMAVTFVGSEGKVLVIDDNPADTEAFRAALREGEIASDRLEPGGLIDGLVQLSGYDAVVLANVPRHAFDETQVRELHAYVHDLGGGLIMLGGEYSFGAGGWINSDIEKAMPVKFNPPQSRQMVRGALALIMHSCEMPQGNYWGQKVAEAAINALSRLDYVGLVEYAWNAGPNAINNCTWALPLSIVGDKVRAINATKQLQMGDMPDFDPSLQLAYNGLTNIQAGKRHVIIISDGDPAPPSQQLLADYRKAKISITTVMVGGHGSTQDRNRMRDVADKTGGNFHSVQNPKKLPAIFIKEAEVVTRSLIQEGSYQPQVASTLPGPTEGFRDLGEIGIGGYVVTAQRKGLAQTPFV
ncbi:MAG: VWA domain-containing protein, partial [Planctomycetota bacterium]